MQIAAGVLADLVHHGHQLVEVEDERCARQILAAQGGAQLGREQVVAQPVAPVQPLDRREEVDAEPSPRDLVGTLVSRQECRADLLQDPIDSYAGQRRGESVDVVVVNGHAHPLQVDVRCRGVRGWGSASSSHASSLPN